jgi:cytochrome c oxidase subunit 4
MEHITPRRTYFIVYLALLGLLALTVFAASVNLGPFNLAITLAIASAKAALVILFFMGIRYADNVAKMFAIAGFVWLLILMGLVLADYITRFPGTNAVWR